MSDLWPDAAEDELSDAAHDTIDASTGGITGTLEQMSVAQILGMMAMTPRRAFVEVRSEGTAGGVGFDATGPIAARFGALVGLEAVLALLRVPTGTFCIVYDADPGAPNLSRDDVQRVARWIESLAQGGAPETSGVRAPAAAADDDDDELGSTLLDVDQRELLAAARGALDTELEGGPGVTEAVERTVTVAPLVTEVVGPPDDGPKTAKVSALVDDSDNDTVLN